MEQKHIVRIGDHDLIISVQELEKESWMATTSFRDIPYAARARTADQALAALVQVLQSEG